MKKIFAFTLVLVMLLSGCLDEPVQEQSGAQSESGENVSQSENIADESEEPKAFSSVYSYSAAYKKAEIENLWWIDGNLLFWTEVNGTSYEMYVADVENGNEKCIYSLHSDDHFSVNTYTSEERIYIDLRFYPNRQLLVFDKNSLELINESPLEEIETDYFRISSKDIIFSAPSQYSNEITFYHFDTPEEAYTLKLDDIPRYSHTGTAWSLSGEYIFVNNFDACGFDKYSNHMEALGKAEDGYPFETQYDIFTADGNYVSSFKVDESNGVSFSYVNWVFGDRIFIETVYCDEENGYDDHLYKLIDINGNVLWTKEVLGEDLYFHQFAENGVFGFDRSGVINLYFLSFATGEIEEKGIVSENTSQNIRVSPNGKYILIFESVRNHPYFSVVTAE